MRRIDESNCLRSWELALGIGMTCIAVGLHVLFLTSAGSLWRDEINTLRCATVGTLTEVIASLKYNLAPILHFLVVREWVTAGWGLDPDGLRVLGLIVGLGILGALWINARIFDYSVPFVGVVLLGLSSTFIRGADSLRPYGLGAFFSILTFGFYWLVSKKPQTKTVVLAIASGTLMVQCLYQNGLLLAAVCLGGIAACLRRRMWRRSALMAGMGLGSALTMVPYLSVWQRVQDWAVVAIAPDSTGYLKGTAIGAFGSPYLGMIWIWAALWLFSGFVTLAAWRPHGEGKHCEWVIDPDIVKYAAVVLVASTVAYLIFIAFLNRAFLYPWHYIPLIAMQAACLDVIWGQYKRWMKLRLALVVLLVVMVAPGAWKGVGVRQTSVDLIAAKLEKVASKDDLIIVFPWWVGVSFNHYYIGQAPWVTVPPLDDLSMHRFDLLKEKMMEKDPMNPVVTKVKEVLRGGNTVWMVGWATCLKFPQMIEWGQFPLLRIRRQGGGKRPTCGIGLARSHLLWPKEARPGQRCRFLLSGRSILSRILLWSTCMDQAWPAQPLRPRLRERDRHNLTTGRDISEANRLVENRTKICFIPSEDSGLRSRFPSSQCIGVNRGSECSCARGTHQVFQEK